MSFCHGCGLFPPCSIALRLAVYAVSQPRIHHTMVIWPILGIIFLPFTTLMYVLVYNPLVGVTGWGWLWVFFGLVLDISSYSSSAYTNRNRMPGYSGT